jgi:hypothetical protein
MDWRRPIDEQKPVAPAAQGRAEKAHSDFAHSEDYRRAAGNPDLMPLALQANALREQLRREGRKL